MVYPYLPSHNAQIVWAEKTCTNSSSWEWWLVHWWRCTVLPCNFTQCEGPKLIDHSVNGNSVYHPGIWSLGVNPWIWWIIPDWAFSWKVTQLPVVLLKVTLTSHWPFKERWLRQVVWITVLLERPFTVLFTIHVDVYKRARLQRLKSKWTLRDTDWYLFTIHPNCRVDIR